MKIAWIGTGVMGAPMAKHLAKAGHDVHVYNRTFEKAKRLEPEVTAHETIEAVVRDADVIFSIVGYPTDVDAVIHEVMNHANPQSILVDMTTSSPSLAQALYEEGATRGFKVVDAPVTGGDLGAINATLSIMVGADQDVFDTIKPLLDIMGKTITYMGPAGSGQHAKLANQVAIAGAIGGAAESLRYAEMKGLNLDAMLQVITGGSANSWQGANNGPKMIVKDFEPGFYVKHFLKDLKLVMSEKGDLRLPITEGITEIYEILSRNGYDNFGTQAIIDYYLKDLK
ncbi:NAD(P)-dependent oxidoreductase [Erysipelothrix sp. HDW6B]|uniref:NAD(P)-dependent oxidoreductase n=1 Tax=Erysipelothrix TaxID=1647 RepID=UPI00135C79E7|nr:MULTISPECIES: NAD(P)-dependent oxidoreductase [Erysipelothrix]QIK85976.1 NAD(P)-dependent oxidoreductase [Erysipelothrix sp. HDW6B]